jgi:hypothetical protein
MKHRRAPVFRRSSLFLAGLMVAATAACSDQSTPTDPAAADLTPSASVLTRTINYDSKNLDEYLTKWANIYGDLEVEPGVGGTRSQAPNGEFTVRAVPFHVGADFSVFDHLKYIAISTQEFQVPEEGSLEFSVRIEASTPGTIPGRVIQGCYGGPFSYPYVGAPCAQPWSAEALEGMQAGVVLNMINFATGQLFDWFVSENQVFALIERLPSNVTGSPGVGLDKAYTQIIKVGEIKPGKKHHLAIRYSRGPGLSRVEYFLNGQLFTSVDNVGVPLDEQGVPYTGIHPSLGPGEALSLDSFVMGHGLFSLLDAFPYQHPDRPDLSVSIPMSERLFGQGAVGTFKDFKVSIR